MSKLSLGDLWIQLCLSPSQTQPLGTPVYSSERLFRLAMPFLVLQFYLIPQEQISLRQTWLHGWWCSSVVAGLVVQLSGCRTGVAVHWLQDWWCSSVAAGLVVQLSDCRADGTAQWLHGW